MADGGYRERAHPADLCLEVWGVDRAALYRNAAKALFETLDFCLAPTAEPASCSIALQAPDPETLMVDWLSELLYQSDIQRAWWHTFDLHQVTPTVLRGTVLGQRPATPRREVKAVTYTGLEISQDDRGQWSATITFDV
ncbi:MAG: archease [Anaerolineales bacterium]